MTTTAMFNPPSPRTDPEALQRHQAALARLLEEGQRYTTAHPHQATAVDLRGWHDRLRWVTMALADYFEAPARAAVIDLLNHPTIEDDDASLPLLRMNIAGASFDQFGAEVGVNGNTIRRIEEKNTGCNVGTAKKIADRFGLRVLEMFDHDAEGEKLVPRTVGDLRERLTDR